MTAPIAAGLILVGYCTEMIGFFVWLRLRSYARGCGWFGLSGALWTLADIIVHAKVAAIWTAMWTTYYLWIWWNRGGGDKTKKRLKRWARKFTPVRRTAPQMTQEQT